MFLMSFTYVQNIFEKKHFKSFTQKLNWCIIPFLPIASFWSPEKHPNTFGFLMLLGESKGNIGKKRVYDNQVRLYWEKDILSNWLVPVFFFICFPVLFLISHQSVDIRSLNFIFKSKDSWITIFQELPTDYPRCLRAVIGHEKQIEIKIISNEVKNSWRLGDNDNDVPRLNFIVNHFCFIILIILTKVKKS